MGALEPESGLWGQALGSRANIGASGAKIGGSRAKIGGSGANIEGSRAKISDSGQDQGLLKKDRGH